MKQALFIQFISSFSLHHNVYEEQLCEDFQVTRDQKIEMEINELKLEENQFKLINDLDPISDSGRLLTHLAMH